MAQSKYGFKSDWNYVAYFYLTFYNWLPVIKKAWWELFLPKMVQPVINFTGAVTFVLTQGHFPLKISYLDLKKNWSVFSHVIFEIKMWCLITKTKKTRCLLFRAIYSKLNNLYWYQHMITSHFLGWKTCLKHLFPFLLGAQESDFRTITAAGHQSHMHTTLDNCF